MPGSILGTAVRRVEDPDLLLGLAQFVDDLPLAGALHLAFVRSTYAHVRIVAVDVTEAQAMPGVVGVFVADDLQLPPYEGLMQLNAQCLRPPLAVDKVRFVGDTIAVVVAETRAAAADAVEAVVVDYDPLPAVVDMEDALAPGAPAAVRGARLESGGRDPPARRRRPVGGCRRGRAGPLREPAHRGDADGAERDRGRARRRRRGARPHGVRLDADAARLREAHRADVRARRGAHAWVAPHVGGAFGGKPGLMAEHCVAVGVALRLQRTVKWIETRSENLVAMPHGRGQVQYVELGLQRDGTIVGMRCRIVADAGAYGGFGGALAMGPTRMMAQGVYRIPKISYETAVALTNTTPMGAFRGAGRPEAAAMLERIMDLAGVELGIDPAEIRRRNFLRPDEFPYTTVMRTVYDSGDYDRALTEALKVAGYDALRAEQAARRARDDRMLLGIGVSAYVEITAGGGGGEYASVTVDADGTATIRVGTSAHGQGHATAFAMIVADQLRIPIEHVRFVQSDTAEVPEGGGTGGSRSLQLGGSAVLDASVGVIARAEGDRGDDARSGHRRHRRDGRRSRRRRGGSGPGAHLG